MGYFFTCFAALVVLVVIGFYIGSKLGPSGKTTRQRKPPAHNYDTRGAGVGLDRRSVSAQAKRNAKKGIGPDNGY